MLKKLFRQPGFPVLLVLTAVGQGQWSYPASPVQTVVDNLHGTRIADDFRWLEDDSSLATAQWIQAQNVLTRSILDTLPTRAYLDSTLTALYDLPTMSVPEVYGNRIFVTRRAPGQNHGVLFYTDRSPGEAEHAVLDPNTFSADGTVALDWAYPSPDGRLVAYGISSGGGEMSTLKIREVDTGTDLALEIPFTRASPVVWNYTAGGFYYVRYPEPGTVPAGDEHYFRRLYFHDLQHSGWREDSLVFGSDLGREDWVDAYASADKRFMFITVSVDWIKNDLYMQDLDGDGEIIPVATGLEGRFSASANAGILYILTDYLAPHRRLLTTPVSTPGQEYWTELVPEGTGLIESFALASGQVVIRTLQDAVSQLWILTSDGGSKWELPLPTLGRVAGLHGSPAKDKLYFGFESFMFPPAVYEFDFFTSRLKIIYQTPVTRDLSTFMVSQVFFPSLDGTSIPMFLVHRNSLPLDGNHPTLLYGYGGFNISMTPRFSYTLIPWLEKGGVYAVANLRGGGEYGRTWHAAGRLERKQNVFNDFIAAGEWLIDNGYTRAERLAAMGGSNGGLLVGAVLTQQPHLWKAAVCGVPLLDMLRYHKSLIARLWIPEYGTSEDPDQFRWLLAYSPYHNVRTGIAYPAVLLTTSEFDSRVHPLHARKMTALLQRKSTGWGPVLLRYEQQAGHGPGKPINKIVAAKVDELAFLMWQLGMR